MDEDDPRAIEVVRCLLAEALRERDEARAQCEDLRKSIEATASFMARVEAQLAERDAQCAARRDPECLARMFHETYERLAPAFHYETRRESAVPWDSVPDTNKKLMIAVAKEVGEALSTDAGKKHE